MTLEEACTIEIESLQSWYGYIPDGPDDHWKTEAEMDRSGGGDCEDFAALCCVLACRRVGNEPDESIGMVIGDTPNGCHAWVELGEGRRWVEPTPGYPLMIGEPREFNRTPRFYRRFVPGVGFTDKATYHKGA